MDRGDTSHRIYVQSVDGLKPILTIPIEATPVKYRLAPEEGLKPVQEICSKVSTLVDFCEVLKELRAEGSAHIVGRDVSSVTRLSTLQVKYRKNNLEADLMISVCHILYVLLQATFGRSIWTELASIVISHRLRCNLDVSYEW
jgi:hypothetical protein